MSDRVSTPGSRHGYDPIRDGLSDHGRRITGLESTVYGTGRGDSLREEIEGSIRERVDRKLNWIIGLILVGAIGLIGALIVLAIQLSAHPLH